LYDELAGIRGRIFILKDAPMRSESSLTSDFFHEKEWLIKTLLHNPGFKPWVMGSMFLPGSNLPSLSSRRRIEGEVGNIGLK